jgi:hypothetical protein
MTADEVITEGLIESIGILTAEIERLRLQASASRLRFSRRTGNLQQLQPDGWRDVPWHEDREP